MTRRAFVGMVAGTVALASAPAGYGAVTLDRWEADGFRKRRARTLLNGHDITAECFYFDDRRRVAKCYQRNAEGAFYLDPRTNQPAIEILRGHIEVVFP
jgi:hypothetical protein